MKSPKHPRRFYSDFKEFLLKFYHKGDLYNPDHLWKTFDLYWRFLKTYADPRLTECTPQQQQSYYISITEPESIDWRTRRGGKSLAFAVMGPFFSLIEFGKYEGQVVYRCPYSDQLTQFSQWLKKNPFVDKVSLRSRHEADIIDSLPINADKLSDATSASKGASVFLNDESKKIEIGSALQDYYLETRGIFIEDAPEKKRIMHKSTGGGLSQFELDVERLTEKQERLNRLLVMRIPWQDCPWITQESIDEEMKMNLDAPWYVDQEYNCINTPRGGTFFNPARLHILGNPHEFPMNYLEEHGLSPNVAGLDWNGEIVGHIMEVGYFDNQQLFIMEEITFKTVAEVNNWIRTHPRITVEVEGRPKKDGYNAGFSDHLATLGATCSYQSWQVDEGGSLKQNRLAILQNLDVYVNPLCKWFIRNFKQAKYDPKQLIPTLLKTPDQHGLDGALHMCHGGGALDFPQQRAVDAQAWDDLIDTVRMRSVI